MDIGARVAEARTGAGLTQAQLASAIGIERSALAKIETGLRRVSAVELVAIGRELRRRVEWFVEPGPEAIVSYRAAHAETATQRIDTELERIVRDVEFVVESHPQLVDNQPNPSKQPGSTNDAETLAAEARGLLGLRPDTPANDLTGLVAGIGLLSFAVLLGDGADGGTVLLRTGGVSVINGDLQAGRRRLTLAHELGHYLIADPYTTDWRVASADTEALETRLDRFARALLLPEEDLRDRWSEWTASGEVRDAAVRAGSHYRVDMSTLARRLTECRVIDADTANYVRGARTRRADIVEMDLVVHHEMEPVSLPRPYERAVLDLYRSELISEDRALDLLLDTFERDELPDLPPTSQGEIWTFGPRPMTPQPMCSTPVH